MKFFLLFLFVFWGIVLQTSFSFLGVGFNFVLVLGLFLVLKKDFNQVWFLILGLSLVIDFYSGLPFGLLSASIVLTVFLADLVNRNIVGQLNPLISVLMVFGSTLVYNLVLIFLVKIMDSETNLAGSYHFIRFISLEVIYNIVIFWLICYGFKKIQNKNKLLNRYRS